MDVMQTFHFSSAYARGTGRRCYSYRPTEDPAKTSEAEKPWRRFPEPTNACVKGDTIWWDQVFMTSGSLSLPHAPLTGHSPFYCVRLTSLDTAHFPGASFPPESQAQSFLGVLNCSIRASLLILPKFSIGLCE